jgi:heme/copper-type cytochrome/quinol oxidase subunit 3
VSAAIVPAAAPIATSRSRPITWWGMVAFCSTEGMLFAAFLASFLFLHGTSTAFGAEGGHFPDLRLPLVMTAVLLSSSVTLEWGMRGMRAGNSGRLRLGLLLTFALGALFLLLQALEYAHHDIGSTVSAYHSVSITTTTFHGAHVALGLLMNLWMQARLWTRATDRKQRETAENVALYWHFVDGVWLAVVAVLYLSPRLW